MFGHPSPINNSRLGTMGRTAENGLKSNGPRRRDRAEYSRWLFDGAALAADACRKIENPASRESRLCTSVSLSVSVFKCVRVCVCACACRVSLVKITDEKSRG